MPVSEEPASPFESIESAQEFLSLLEEAVGEARAEIEAQVTQHQPERRLQALQLVGYNLAKLSLHMGTSRRILNDLRILRRLLLQERQIETQTLDE
jgi:hypothetical protein